MKTKYNLNLEILKFIILYLRMWMWVICVPIVVILTPVATFVDWLILDKCKYGFWNKLYRNYVELTNMRINL